MPGDVEESELIYRGTSDDACDRMPPPHAGDALSADEVATLERFRARDGVTGTADEDDLPERIDEALLAGPSAEPLGPFARGPRVERLRSFLEEVVERPGAKR